MRGATFCFVTLAGQADIPGGGKRGFPPIFIGLRPDGMGAWPVRSVSTPASRAGTFRVRCYRICYPKTARKRSLLCMHQFDARQGNATRGRSRAFRDFTRARLGQIEARQFLFLCNAHHRLKDLRNDFFWTTGDTRVHR
jgi:hypothetical protein